MQDLQVEHSFQCEQNALHFAIPAKIFLNIRLSQRSSAVTPIQLRKHCGQISMGDIFFSWRKLVIREVSIFLHVYTKQVGSPYTYICILFYFVKCETKDPSSQPYIELRSCFTLSLFLSFDKSSPNGFETTVDIWPLADLT